MASSSEENSLVPEDHTKTVFHYYKPNDCSRGHRYSVKFLSRNSSVSWIKVCRRCGKETNGNHTFE